MKTEIISSQTETTKILGVDTEVIIEQKREGNEIVITASFTPPSFVYDRNRNILRVFPA